jgi:hypothetical protein
LEYPKIWRTSYGDRYTCCSGCRNCFTGGAAAPLLITAVAYVTAAAGAATVAYGLSEIGESVTDYNVIRDGLMAGNEDLYNKTKNIVSTTANVGSTIIGAYGITKVLQNAGKITTKIRMSQLQNNPLDEFVTIGPKSGRIGEYIQSISRSGSYEPIYVTKLENGLYQIANGHHRVAALKALGYDVVRAFITK